MADAYAPDPGTTETILRKAGVDLGCSSCGGHRVFDPEAGKLKCEQCGSLSELSAPATSSIVEHDFSSAEDTADPEWNASNKVLQCGQCGARTVLAGLETARRCAFCGSPQIADAGAVPGIRPESVVPFRVDRKKANEAFRVWLTRRFFAPQAVKREYLQDRIAGVYLPYWTYDADTLSAYTGQAGDYYYVTVTRTENQNGKPVTVSRQERRIRWRWVSGEYAESFDDLLVAASKTLEGKWLDKIEPFPMDALQPYRPDFLSGFSAERYSVGLQEGFDVAKGRMDTRIRAGIRSAVHADELRLQSLDTHYTDVTYKHLLLPLWISSYRYGNKVYRFLVNGSTAKVTGSYPVSASKVLLTIVAAIAALGLLYLVAQALTGA